MNDAVGSIVVTVGCVATERAVAGAFFGIFSLVLRVRRDAPFGTRRGGGHQRQDMAGRRRSQTMLIM